MMTNHYHLLLLTLFVFIYVKSRDDKYMKGDITVYAFPIYKECIYCFWKMEDCHWLILFVYIVDHYCNSFLCFITVIYYNC